MSLGLAVLAGQAAAASGVLLLRLFLADGTALVSYGEFTRVEGEVMFSTLVGGTADAPRLQVVSIPAATVDWVRTDADSVAVRRYHAEMHASGGASYRAGAESASPLTTDTPADTAVDGPVLSMPTLSAQLDQVLAIADLTARADDRVAVLQAALLLLDDLEGQGVLLPRELALARTTTNQRIAFEHEMDRRYAALSRELLAAAATAAGAARIADVEQILVSIPARAEALGGGRPDLVRGLEASVRAQLETARRERLRQDQWDIRRQVHDEYQRIAGAMIQNLLTMKPSLDAIRRLDGPAPDTLVLLQRELRGGADRLELMLPPDLAQSSHELFVTAWRFAETAVATRYEAAVSGDVETAWQASSAAAGALSLLERAEAGLQALVAPPPRQ